jgi:uncharacterized YccA/Bax inhibitor family protein
MDKSSNPAFNTAALREMTTAGAKTMSRGGTYLKTGFLFIITVMVAVLTWRYMADQALAGNINWWALWLTSLGSFFVGMIISFNPRMAPVLSIPYSVMQGALLGVISGIYANSFQGIVGQAIFLTLSLFAAVYLAYSTGIIKASSKFVKVIIGAMLGLMVYYIFASIFSLFGTHTPLVYSYGPWGIAFSFAVVLLATLSLVLDFDFIDRAVANGMPRYMEWYGAYGLLVGLIWLYLQILQLLAKLAAARN